MAYQTIKRSKSFIESIAIKKPTTAKRRAMRALDAPVSSVPVELQDQTAQAIVVGSGLVFAEEGVAKQVKEDLLACTLAAQLYATSKAGTATKALKWYDAYFAALLNFGWAMTSQDFREVTAGGTAVQVHKAILGALTAALGPGATALVVVKSVLNGLDEMGSENGWLTLFDRESVTDKVAKFQVITAQPAKDGQINIGLVGFELVAKSTVTQVLFFKFKKSSAKLRFTGGAATIFEPVLAEVRDKLKKKLATVTDDFVDSIPIPRK